MVLGALCPARRSMVGSMRRSPEEIMAGLTVALADVSIERKMLAVLRLTGHRVNTRHAINGKALLNRSPDSIIAPGTEIRI